jgi:GT2 family glycosyltransferase
MDVSIIIVNYNTGNLTKACINSIFEKGKAIQLEVFVIDNASTDNSIDILQSDDRIILLPNAENLGFGKANNIGIKLAKGRNILFLNPDTLLVNNAVKVMSDFLDTHSYAGACGGNLLGEDLQPVKSFSRFFPGLEEELNDWSGHRYERLRYRNNTFYNNSGKALKVAFVSGANMMVKKKVIDVTGGFDQDFFLFYEETELSMRIRKAGYLIYSLPDAKIIHLVSRSFNLPESKAKAYYMSRQIYYKKVFPVYKIKFLNFLFVSHHLFRAFLAKMLNQKEIFDSNKRILRAYFSVKCQ